MTYDKEKKWLRNISLFLSSQTISLFGSSLVQYAMMWYITLETQSGMMMTIYTLCGFIPTFILSPLAGVWADRYNRKILIMTADGLIAFATFILAILFMLGYESTWLLFVMAAIRAVGTGIQTPAVGAILPQIVPTENLTKVNGINGSIQAIIAFASPMISAALIQLASMEVIFFIDVITATIAILTLLIFLKIPAHEKARGKQEVSYLSDFKEGLHYVNTHAFLKQFFVFFAIFFVLMSPAIFLTPLQVTRSFGDDVWKLTAIEIAFSIGMMLGGGVIAMWGGFSNRIKTMILSSFIMGFCTFLLGIVPIFWIYLGVMVIFGVAMPIFNTPANVLFQEKIEEDYLGRVFGVLGMVSTSMMPLGMVIFGPIADIIPVEWLLIGTGFFMIVLTIVMSRNKILIKAGESS